MLDRDTLLEFFMGDESALDFFMMMYDIMHVWDDLIDRDKEVSAYQITDSYIKSLIGIDQNLFYRNFGDQLQPVMLFIFNHWLESNKLERESENGQNMAFTLRALTMGLVPQMAFYLGDFEHMRKVSEKVWAIMAELESLDSYKEELKKCQTQSSQ